MQRIQPVQCKVNRNKPYRQVKTARTEGSISYVP